MKKIWSVSFFCDMSGKSISKQHLWSGKKTLELYAFIFILKLKFKISIEYWKFWNFKFEIDFQFYMSGVQLSCRYIFEFEFEFEFLDIYDTSVERYNKYRNNRFWNRITNSTCQVFISKIRSSYLFYSWGIFEISNMVQWNGVKQFSHNKPEFQIINEALYPPFFVYYGRGKAKQQSVHIMYHLPLIFSNIFLCSINWLNCQAFQTVALSRNINEE